MDYILIEMDAYHKVWYKLHMSADSSRWTNALILTELCYSFPFSNGSIEVHSNQPQNKASS